MKKFTPILIAASLTVAGLIGCGYGGPGYHGTTSEENVGSRSSHELNSPNMTEVPTTPPPADNNAANVAIDRTHGVGGFGGSSQENDASGTAGGIGNTPTVPAGTAQ